MNDDTLTLYYYNDGLSNQERQQVANTLATDAAIAERYQALCRALDGLTSADPGKPPADMVRRWHDSLDRAAGIEMQAGPKPAVHSWSFFLGTAVTAALAVGVGIGIFISGDEPTAVPVMRELIVANPEPRASSAFMRGLQVHLRESEQGLSTLSASTTPDRTLLIMNIIEQNRLFERAAEQNDSASLARVLRAFELVLIQLAADDITPEEAEALRAKLLFELNVVLTKLSRDTSDEPQSI
jgi:hypothetical protein